MSGQCNAELAYRNQTIPVGDCPTCQRGPCNRTFEHAMVERNSTKRPLRTLVLSPFAGDVVRNKAYAQDCMTDSLRRGEAPFLSHLLYPQVLIDNIPSERETGLRCERSWFEVAEQVIAYVDLGWSPGMLSIWDTTDTPTKQLFFKRTLGGAWTQSSFDLTRTTLQDMPEGEAATLLRNGY